MTQPAIIQPGQPKEARRGQLHLGALRFSLAQFLFALGLMLVVDPFVDQMQYGNFIETVLLTLVLLSAVLAVGGSLRTLLWAVVLVIPAVAGRWMNKALSEQIFPGAGLVPGLVFVAFIVFQLLRFILRAPRVNSEVLCAGIAAYLMLGLFWAVAYSLVERLVPNSFAFTASALAGQTMLESKALYFSFITLCTVGYGDIIPVSPVARMLAMMEAVIGAFYMTMMIARLVALYSSPGDKDQRETINEPDAPP